MQHNNPAATVDSQHCADAVIDAVDVMEHCFSASKITLPDKLKVTLRVMRLLSQHGDPHQQSEFGNAMQQHPWRGNRERAKQDEVIVAPGPGANWGLVIPSEFARVRDVAGSSRCPTLLKCHATSVVMLDSGLKVFGSWSRWIWDVRAS